MTREEKIKRLEKFCDSIGDELSDCYKCPLNEYDWCEKLFDNLSDDELEESINLIDSYEAKTDSEKELEELEKDFDTVECPRHYTSTSIECIDAMIETQGVAPVFHFCICNAFKYLWRHEKKNGFEDLKKAAWYLNKAIELEENYNE